VLVSGLRFGFTYANAKCDHENTHGTAEDCPEVRGDRLPVEVKGDSSSAIANARRSISSAFGRGMIVTNSRLDLEHGIPTVPASLFLASLGERPERKPTSI